MPQPRILHESEHLLVLDKPAGWHTTAPGESQEDAEPGQPSIESHLRSHHDWAADLPDAGLLHRLDQPTTGCIAAAKTSDQWHRLRQLWSGSTIGKTYLALVAPAPPDVGRFDLHFTSRYRRSRKVTVSGDGETNTRGRCTWRRIAGDDHGTLLKVELVGPGQRHQVRAGLAHCGHPILGDPLYGGNGPMLCLHAWRLRIEGVEIQADSPAWARLGE